MTERTFACAEFCSSMELGPDLGPSTKPCDCWNAEITTLRDRVKELEDLLELGKAGAMDLEEELMGATALIGRKSARIRELEQAMPDVSLIRDTIKHLRREGYGSMASPLESMADRIEKVMKR